MDLNRSSLRVALMLESEGMGGAEVVMFDLAVALRERGHRPVPIVSESDKPGGAKSWLGEKFRDNGFKPHTYHFRHALEVGQVRKLGALLRQQEMEVLHGHEFDGTVYGAAAAAIAGRACIATLHGNQTMTAAWPKRAALRWAFRSCHAVTAVSQVTKGQFDQDLGCDPGAISVVRNGVPVRRGDAAPVRRELGVREGELLILAVGNLIPRKGHIVLLQALQHLCARGLTASWHLAIAGVGAGDERPRLEAFARENGLSERVHILGQREDIPDLQAAADVFAMPSLWEGFPLAILEAMLAGTAIVASRVSGIPEAVEEEVQGVLVPPGDVEALAGALARVLADPVLRASLANGARERAEREFTIDAMTDAYESLYRSACATAAPPVAPMDRPGGARG
jgi:glycosyltransferase involved in cell wall biosynthesis